MRSAPSGAAMVDCGTSVGGEKVSAAGVENVDLSSVVGPSHFLCDRRMSTILSLLRFMFTHPPEVKRHLLKYQTAAGALVVIAAAVVAVVRARVEQVSAVGVENVDLSSVVGSNHFSYNRRMPEILSLLALDDCSKYIARGDQPQLNSSRRFSAASTATASSRSLENGTAPSTPTSTSTFAGRDGSDGTTLFP